MVLDDDILFLPPLPRLNLVEMHNFFMGFKYNIGFPVHAICRRAIDFVKLSSFSISLYLLLLFLYLTLVKNAKHLYNKKVQ